MSQAMGDPEAIIIFADPRFKDPEDLSVQVFKQKEIAWPQNVIDLKGEVGIPVQLELELQPMDE